VDLEVPRSSRGGGTSIRSKPHSPLSDQSFQLILRRGMRKGTCSSSALARDVIGSRPPAAFRSFDLCAGGGIGGLKRRLRARGGISADANEREQSGEAPNHSPAMSHRNPPRLPQFSTRSRATLKIILADTKRGGGNSGDSDAAASQFVRNGSASLSFDTFSRIRSSAFTVAAARSPVTPSSCSLLGVITLGAVIGSGNGFVSPK
jgi:hypothetical protein